jgi:hypothetical protein
MLENSELYKKVISEENIYKAIYSLESYVFEKELLSNEDIEKFTNLTDKYNKKFIDKVIAECKEKIEKIFKTDDLFDIKVFFKPKKYDTTNNKVEFRPIHSADLITQICIVSLLNLIMFDDSEEKRKLSDISRLLPSNFYGNIPSTNIDYLFEPWNRKYQEYSEKAIKTHSQYYKTKKYENEINLDLKKFFPTIDPVFIYNFIIAKWPITSSIEDNKCLKIILEKLLFFNINLPEEWFSVYYSEDIIKKIKSNNTYYNIGIPQGLPQAYFFGNICMLIIAKEIKTKFKGDAFYYVDDSVIYTTTNENDFYSNIRILNDTINDKIIEAKKLTIQNAKINKFNSLVNYTIEIHNDQSGKSTISNINLEESLYEFAKPASAISFEIKAAIDELEDTSLRDKIEAILSAINFKLSETTDNKEVNNENNLKLLRRYKKFYTNRLNILKQRDENEITIARIEEFYLKYELEKKPSHSCFFDKFEDDVFTFECKSLIRQLEVNPEAQNEIISKVKMFEQQFDKVIRSSYNYFSTVLSNCVEFQKYHNKNYDYLEIRTSKTIESFSKVKKKKKNEVIQSIVKLMSNSKIELFGESEKRINCFFNEYQNGYFRFVSLNSPEFNRKIVNALISKSLNVTTSDSCNFIKFDSRAIHYNELRLLMYIRSFGFITQKFVYYANSIISELEQKQSFEKIDLSLLEVLPIFKRYVKDPEKVDDLILIHKYVNGIWKNGSKFLHFYTLHNEEHSIELINNCIRITKTIDYLSIKTDDYYILFLACYLHDISMVLYPNLDNFAEDNGRSDLIYSQWKTELSEIMDIELEPKSKIKQFILKYYESVNNHFETEIRDNHHKRSSQFIKEQSDLSFIDKPLRSLVADVSEAHCYNAKDVYKLKSKAKNDLIDEKYLMIILRLADLLDMSKDRVSINILRQNINNMSEISKYHWISHMAIDNCNINSHFIPFDEKSIIEEHIKLTEIIQINIFMNTKLLNSSNSLKCKNLSCEILKDDYSEYYLKIAIQRGSECDGKNCNFSCKWITNKHKYLFDELIELKQYLDRNVNNIFKTEFEVNLKFENTSVLPPDYLDVIKERIE